MACGFSESMKKENMQFLLQGLDCAASWCFISMMKRSVDIWLSAVDTHASPLSNGHVTWHRDDYNDWVQRLMVQQPLTYSVIPQVNTCTSQYLHSTFSSETEFLVWSLFCLCFTFASLATYALMLLTTSYTVCALLAKNQTLARNVCDHIDNCAFKDFRTNFTNRMKVHGDWDKKLNWTHTEIQSLGKIS